MDDKDQAKDHRAGHEGHGVHVCHKCGWPFPNPHPSAKHRRAHKKICGTIEGYRLVDLEETAHLTVSDDEHASDGDHKTPSPKLPEKSANETGSIGMGQRSARSEDDVFSDAVTEFPEGGSVPAMEEHPRCIREPATNAEIIAKNDDKTSQSYDGDANTAITSPLNNSADSSLMQNMEVPKGNLSGSVHGSQDHVSSADISSVAGHVTCNDDGSYACDSDSNKLETQSNANKDYNESSSGEDLIEHGTKQNDSSILDHQLPDDVLLAGQNAEITSDAVLELGKAEDIALIPAQAAGLPLLEKEQNHDSKVNLNDVPSVAKHVEYMNASVDPVEIKVDAAERMDTAGSGDPIESCDTLGKLAKDMHVVAIEGCNALGELGKDVPVLSVPESAGNAEIMIEGFKDHKGGRLPKLIQGTSLDVGNDTKETLPKSNLSTSHVSVFPDDTVKQMSTDNLEPKYGSNKPMIKKFPDEEEADRPLVTDETKEIQRSEELEMITAVKREKTNIVQTPEKKPPCDYKDEQLATSLGERAKEDLDNLNPVVGTMGTEIRQTTGLAGINDADNYEKAAIERCDIDRDNGNKEMKESSIVNIIATSEPVDSLSGQEINTVTVLIGGDNAADCEENEIEGYDVSSVGTGKSDSAATLVEDKLPMRAEATSKSTVDLHESHAFSESATDLFDFKLTDTECTHPGGIQDAQEGIKKLETTGNDKGLGEHVGGISIPAEDVNFLDVKATQESAAEHQTKEPLVSSLEISASILSPVIVEDNRATDVVGVASGTKSEFLTGEGESNLDSKAVLQQLGTSANNSVDSSSQTDSVEGHWGSVSVLSTQSDVPAIVDTEPSRSNGFQAPTEADEVSLKGSKAAPEGQRSDKSDIYEPPSFMTLVEPRVGIHQTDPASEIQMTQHTQQAITASLEPSWFPSLTNVVNESQGRKKNEKIIAKVTNWNTGKQHAPLKSLLHEANVETKSKLPNATTKQGPSVEEDGTTAKDDGASLATVSSVMTPEATHAEVTKREAAKEWNSPARYPAEIKRQKKRVKGKPYWAQFVCCSSVS
uniref:Uncharacterized protein LOC8270577 isoform X1 n=2 Tax=Rhizophora mucronata TaxID=61149 RepID=A0A2P2IW66_RHIMU